MVQKNIYLHRTKILIVITDNNQVPKCGYTLHYFVCSSLIRDDMTSMHSSTGRVFSLNFLSAWPEIVAFPSTGFQVAAWLWRNGYSSRDNSTSPTGDLRRFCNGTEYSFVQLSYNIQGSTSGIEKLFQYWRHTVQVKPMDVSLIIVKVMIS